MKIPGSATFPADNRIPSCRPGCLSNVTVSSSSVSLFRSGCPTTDDEAEEEKPFPVGAEVVVGVGGSLGDDVTRPPYFSIRSRYTPSRSTDVILRRAVQTWNE